MELNLFEKIREYYSIAFIDEKFHAVVVKRFEIELKKLKLVLRWKFCLEDDNAYVCLCTKKRTSVGAA